MDANARGGTYAAVGPYHRGLTNWNGHQLTHLCELHDLVLLNTWWAAASGPTWTDGRGHFSRIDYIAVPRTFMVNVSNVTLMTTTDS
eukprot:13866318-Heterocapsa_arctica.AAC.1